MTAAVSDAGRAGAAAAVEALLRCYVREFGVPVTDPLALDLPGGRLSVEVPYRSATGWHRFGEPRFGDGTVAGPAQVAAAVVRAVTDRLGLPPHAGSDAVARVLDSARRTALHIGHTGATAPTPFLDAEQALLLGHPFHPTPKSREGASEAELRAYSPELGGSFPLHWFAADPSIVAGDGEVPFSGLPSGTIAIPAHPWQARDLLHRPGIQALVRAGLLRDVGPAGPPWYPTSSVRTVYRPDSPVMLKLSLGLRITNSRRNNLRSELDLGVRVARLLDAGLAQALAAAHPGFGIVRDPAWISVDAPGDAPESGLETAIRENPFSPDDRVACVSGLVDDGRGPSRLAALVEGLAARTGRAVDDVSVEWFARYLEVLAAPLLWLLAEWGLALEAHHQNTLVRLDGDGWPIGAWYRDSQGYYVRASQVERVRALLPGIDDGAAMVFPDALTDERVVYYVVVNNLLGLVGAFGAQGLAGEAALLAVLRGFLADHPTGLPLDAPTLPCKGNLLTCVDGRDELVGEVATQSLYTTIPNPLVDG